MQNSNKKVVDETENDEIKVTPFIFRIDLRDELDDYITSLFEKICGLSLKEMLADEEEYEEE